MSGSIQKKKISPIPGVVILAFVLIASFWAVRYFGAEAQVSRATARMVSLAEKTGEESPVALGLAANRLGKLFATNIVLSLKDVGPLTRSRQETIQLFAQIRSSMQIMTFKNPRIAIAAAGKGQVEARVMARYRFDAGSGETTTGEGMAELWWVKGKGGWQVVEALLHAEEGAPLPKGWK